MFGVHNTILNQLLKKNNSLVKTRFVVKEAGTRLALKSNNFTTLTSVIFITFVIFILSSRAMKFKDYFLTDRYAPAVNVIAVQLLMPTAM